MVNIRLAAVKLIIEVVNHVVAIVVISQIGQIGMMEVQIQDGITVQNMKDERYTIRK